MSFPRLSPARFLAGLAAALSLWSAAARAQSNACDLNSDSVVNVVDGQLAVNMYLGLLPCTANVGGPGICNQEVVLRVMNAAKGDPCVTTPLHAVTLTWTASTSANVIGYYIYRGSAVGGPYAKLNTTPVAALTYTDANVQAGQTYYYVATATDNTGAESVYSNEARADIPTP